VLILKEYKPSTVGRRIARRLAVTKCADVDEYYKYILNNPSEVHILFREFLIGVTNFFRDEEAFEVLKTDIIPELVKRTESDSEIRVWVPGCSTGEEAYSLCLLINDYLEKNSLAKNIKVFATGIDKSALQTASKGLFPESIVSNIPNYYLGKYFIKQGNQYLISKKIRESIVFAEHNLLNDPPFTNLHMISCRNLLIYLKPDAQRKVFDIFHFSLKESGILVLGTSENVGDDKRFRPINAKVKIYETIGRTKILTSDRLKDKPSKNREVSEMQLYNNIDYSREIERLPGYSVKSIVENYFKLLAIVNENFDLIYIEGDAIPYFKFPSGSPSLNLSNILNNQFSVHVISAIRKVLNTKKNYRVNTIFTHDNSKINISIDFIYMESPKKIPYVIMVIVEGEEKKVINAKEIDLSLEKETFYKELEQELQITKENLQATIEELETANEELQAANEELLASNEELQSTNEELQSTNEELYTVNAELQEKILEKAEIQTYLENLLKHSETGLLILDNQLTIKRYSPKIKDIFKIIDSDIGRSIEHINHNIVDLDIYEIFRNIIKNQEDIEIEVKTEGGKYYKITSSFIELGLYEVKHGVIIKFEDITDIKEEKNFLKAKYHILSSISDNYKISGWYFDVLENRIYWTKGTYNVFGFKTANFREDASKYMNKVIENVDKPDLFKTSWDKAVKKGTPFELIFNYNTPKDEKLTIKIKCKAIKENKKVVAVVGTVAQVEAESK
jgi:two-component system CheB/CheR fusion protein